MARRIRREGQRSCQPKVSANPSVKVGKLLRFRTVDVREFIQNSWSGGSLLRNLFSDAFHSTVYAAGFSSIGTSL
jgi:hypothetical protein